MRKCINFCVTYISMNVLCVWGTKTCTCKEKESRLAVDRQGEGQGREIFSVSVLQVKKALNQWSKKQQQLQKQEEFFVGCLIPARSLHSERSAAIWRSRPRCESATQFSSSLHGMIGTGFCSLVAPVVGNDNSSVCIRFLAVDAQPTAASLRCGAREKLSLQPATNERKKSCL